MCSILNKKKHCFFLFSFLYLKYIKMNDSSWFSFMNVYKTLSGNITTTIVFPFITYIIQYMTNATFENLTPMKFGLYFVGLISVFWIAIEIAKVLSNNKKEVFNFIILVLTIYGVISFCNYSDTKCTELAHFLDDLNSINVTKFFFK